VLGFGQFCTVGELVAISVLDRAPLNTHAWWWCCTLVESDNLLLYANGEI
jgi:hypothetical protein